MPQAPDQSPDFLPPLPAEERPRDFTARIRRRDVRSILHATRPARARRQRRWGIAATIALGMVLGPLGWGAGPIDPAQARGEQRTLQSFETPGESFPGSALYFVDPGESGVLTPEAAQQAWLSHALDTSMVDPADPAGPAARPLLARAGGEDYARALQCLTTAIYYEAASEPDGGQRAVAQVVLNRVAHPSFPNTVCGVVYQGSERPGCQFSFACDGSLARKPVAAFWDRARRIASDALAGYVYAPVGLATHYHTSAVHPYWADSLAYIGTIGAHRFYRWAGVAGTPAAFNAVYAGREPLPLPHPRTWSPEPPAETDPVLLAKAYEAAQARLPAARSDAAPSYAPALQDRGGDALYKAQGGPQSGSGAVRPEWENAGKWIAQPGS